jgi:DNA invertase Pin-like site-specific DNA recombinase/DNA-binding transcriptional MerR regulator
MEKIGLLYRVSSKPQETDGGGLDIQQKMGIEVSKKLGVSYIEFNEGVQSSFKVEVNERPVLVELLTEIQKTNGIRKVWVFNTDRLGRYSNSWYSILKIFIDYNVEIYVGESSKPYDLNNLGDRLSVGVLSLISQYDNELRRMRSILGKRNSLKNGNTWIGGTVPFGYEVKKKELIINKKESSIVKKMFEMYNNGKTPMDIKVFMDRQTEIKPRRSIKGWNSGTILSMLRKEVYIGKQTWVWKEKVGKNEIKVIETIEINTPKIIDDTLWKEVQEKINDNFPTTLDGRSRKSLLKGFLVCTNCKLKLGHRFKSTNHYYGKCNEVNWRKVGDKIDHKNCPLKKSPRMEDIDDRVFDVIVDVLKNSKTIRENYKINSLNPKFEDKEKNRKLTEDIKRKLRDKNLEKVKVEENYLDIDFDVRIGKLSKIQGDKLKERFVLHLEKLNEEISELNHNLNTISNSKGWVNWLKKVNEQIDEKELLSLEKKREFLNETINKIEIEYNKKNQSHILDINFKLPIVGDSLKFTGKEDKNGFKEYNILDGVSKYNTEIGVNNTKSTSSNPKRIKIMNRIIQLKENEGLSLNEISEILNNEKLYPLNGGKWYKSKLSSFYNYSKQTPPK